MKIIPVYWKKVHATFKEGWKNREVFLYEEDYLNIRDGIGHSTPHKEIELYFETVKETIEKPHQVNEDIHKKRTECYYLWFPLPKIFPMGHMKVVLRNTKKRMIVINAYPVYNISKVEKLLWSSNGK